jgi:hypothetical protein
MWLGLDGWIWLLIGVGVIVIGWLKLTVFSAMTKPKNKKTFQDKED